ncbi:(S)-2-haloacid dehalogenase [Pelagimonas phthalicica]|uniref:(S)-2-haloacid dehalogenase n=1 Tax=Pelagimonas phthalicica TaxID=1037362 RepID=A0A238J7V8_9RHOB|nr:HAD family hydrolase [Pelagimonas phthalicica]TDS95041.1 putative hydrolase of the HAD superfamily [Pelagimonas phthalicica]SMX26433.1 (S)-2-haloacid dehalogenase [Pelagimonas phthalicica]
MSIDPILDEARSFAPILLLDRAEPFRPGQIGVHAFQADGPSPSSKFHVTLRGEICYEYAIFWDHDICHTYDLEHVWVHVAEGKVIAVEATFHGSRHEVSLVLADGQPLIWCEAGAHAHFRNRAHRDQMAEATRLTCGSSAGHGGIHTGNPFAQDWTEITAADHRLAKLYLQRLQFTPCFGHGLAVDLADVPFLPATDLPVFIKARMEILLGKLRTQTPHMPAIFFDCGDTLVDEGTEIKRDDGSDVVISAELIPGAEKVVRDLHDMGYRLCLVADGPRETFENVLKPSGLWDLFEQYVISGDVGVHKPDARMFEVAREKMGLTKDQLRYVPMIGNNLERDILGANRAGHPSFFFDWSDRRRRIPETEDEQPTVQFSRLEVLVHILQLFEFSLSKDP